MSARSRRPSTPSATFRGTPNRRLTSRADPTLVVPATRPESMPVALMSLVAAFVALAISASHGYLLLYGDATSHLGAARRLLDTDHPGLQMLGGVWLPLPHLLMAPFAAHMQWWQNGLAGAFPSMLWYLLANIGLYRLARRVMPPAWAFVATALFALNANLLYLSSTAMTEPLFLALTVWTILVLLELLASLQSSAAGKANQQQFLLGVLILLAVLSRYDGWVLGAAVWWVVAWSFLTGNATVRARITPGFVTLTVLALVGPIFWFWWNHQYAHDWLDFIHGPYSAQAIERNTTPPGSPHHFGWHQPFDSLVLYMRTAQIDFSAGETGWLIAAASLYAAWRVAAGKLWHFGAHSFTLPRALLLLWLPIPFYVYSIAWGSIPIFIPQLYPFSYYNSRYGMEMIPAFAIFAVLALLDAIARLGRSNPTRGQLVARLAQPVALLLVVLNLVWMVHQTPLVLKEAISNSRSRLALEVPMAEQLATIQPGLPILIETNNHYDALEIAAIPLRQTISHADYYRWRDAMRDPAAVAAYVYAVDGDQVAQAAKSHPEGLTQQSIICTTNQPCLRIYRSDRYVTR